MPVLRINCDGGSRGNPGPSGAGCVANEIADDGTKKCLLEKGVFLKDRSNNYAEYQAVIIALEFAITTTAKKVEILSDSKLIVEQMNGNWKVKAPDLAILHRKAQEKLKRLREDGKAVSVKWVPREQNQHADQLANLAMDRQTNAEYLHPSDRDAAKEELLQSMIEMEQQLQVAGNEQLLITWNKLTKSWSRMKLW